MPCSFGGEGLREEGLLLENTHVDGSTANLTGFGVPILGRD
jgi:hypothetical protein